MMTDISTLTNDELQQMLSSSSCWDRDHARDELYRRLEESRKHGVAIGDTIEFVRHGKVPAAGRSTNHRDATAEDGVSVYLIQDGQPVYVGWSFDIAQRPAYTGTGVVVGWGSDGEPLVHITSIRRNRRFDR